MHDVLLALEVVTTLGAACGIAYYVLCVIGAVDHLQELRLAAPVAYAPPVSILKPLKGLDPGAYESFRSHCLQEYPEYEIIFGVADESDPATECVRRLQAEFPERTIKLVHCSQMLGTNAKVSALAQMLPHARYRHLVVNDSDIRVSRDYLREVMRPLHDTRVGLVTALYRGVPGDSLGSKLESIGISTDFIPGVVTARRIEKGVHFGLGSTLAFPRNVLDQIGGFTVLLDYLADDYELGARLSRAGYLIELPATVVETMLPEYSLRGFLQHQLRWGRTVCDRRRAGYFGLLLSFGLPWAILAVLTARGMWWSWLLLAVAAVARVTMAATIATQILHDRTFWRHLWLLPLRDFLAMFLWAGAYMGRRIHWRGESFELKDGRLVRL